MVNSSRLQDVVEASPTPKITTLLKAEVVDIPARTNRLDERSVLRSVGFGKVTVGAMNQYLRYPRWDKPLTSARGTSYLSTLQSQNDGDRIGSRRASYCGGRNDCGPETRPRGRRRDQTFEPCAMMSTSWPTPRARCRPQACGQAFRGPKAGDMRLSECCRLGHSRRAI